LPCVSAAVNVDRLVEDKLYLFIPYQQVQLNDRMTRIKDRSMKSKYKIAGELRNYNIQVKSALENLLNDGKITSTEYETLIGTFADIEQYLREKDKDVDTEVTKMGDENYIPWSERMRAEGRAEIAQELAEKDKALAEKDEKLAEKDERIRELERQLAELKK
jgi:hypothetical protein